METPKGNEHHHHHHHHGHKEDESAIFKRKSLNAIQRRKKIKKLSFIALVITAILMGAAVVLITMLQ